MIDFDKDFTSPTFTNCPNCPFFKISLGPVGHFVEIINFFSCIASNKTFGNPSNLELKINTSANLIYG